MIESISAITLATHNMARKSRARRSAAKLLSKDEARSPSSQNCSR